MLNSVVKPQHQWQECGLAHIEFHTKTHWMELQTRSAKVGLQHVRKYQFKCSAAPYVGGPVYPKSSCCTTLLGCQESMLSFDRFWTYRNPPYFFLGWVIL